jgi:hypothetical protein
MRELPERGRGAGSGDLPLRAARLDVRCLQLRAAGLVGRCSRVKAPSLAVRGLQLRAAGLVGRDSRLESAGVCGPCLQLTAAMLSFALLTACGDLTPSDHTAPAAERVYADVPPRTEPRPTPLPGDPPPGPSAPSQSTPPPGASARNPSPSEPTSKPARASAPPPPPTAAGPVVLGGKSREVEDALRYDPGDPLGNLEAADVLDRGAARSGPRKVVVPPRGCALAEEPRRVWPKPGIAAITAVESGFVLAGYTRAGGAEQVFVVYVAGSGALELLATLPIEVPQTAERKVAPGLAADGEGVTVAYTDGAGSLIVQGLRIGAAHGGGTAAILARGVDTRFAPAVSRARRGALIAYTLGSSPMRVTLLRLDAKHDVLGTHDVTPPAMGAAAPTFTSSDGPDWLITADPRNGMSPIARTPLDREGKPGPAEIAAPVGMMSSPPVLVAAQAEFGTYALYTGLGTAATSAVGLIKLAPKGAAPEAFVKGTAYGPLYAAAASTKRALLIAADAPLAPGKQPSHEIQVALVDEKGLGPLLRVAAPNGDATHVGIAHTDAAGTAIAFSASDGVYLGKLRCVGL